MDCNIHTGRILASSHLILYYRTGTGHWHTVRILPYDKEQWCEASDVSRHYYGDYCIYFINTDSPGGGFKKTIPGSYSDDADNDGF